MKEYLVTLMPVHIKYDMGRYGPFISMSVPFHIAAATDVQMRMNLHQKSSWKIAGFFK
jgi:hypothetical protein